MSSLPSPERRDGGAELPLSARLDDPALALLLLSIAPTALGGAIVRCGPGPEREAFVNALVACLPDKTPFVKVPFNTSDDRLLGGLDLAATLALGTAVIEPGLLARAHGGFLTLAMAERWDTPSTLRVCMAIDQAEVHVERDGVSERLHAEFAVLAFDEGQAEDERVASALADRLAFFLPLTAWAPVSLPTGLKWEHQLPECRLRYDRLQLAPHQIELLVETHAALGVPSLRGLMLAACVARAAAALDGVDIIAAAHVELACRMVLLPRARVLPTGDTADAPPESEREPESPPQDLPPPDQEPDEERLSAQAPEPAPEPSEPEMAERGSPRADEVLEAAIASLPPGLLAMLQGQTRRARRVRRADRGRMGARVRGHQQGRHRGAERGDPRRGGRLAVSATVRAAAPWQRIRLASALDGDHPCEGVPGSYRRPAIRAEDFHVKRFEHQTINNIVFVVDASGSQAMNRLAEAKGAVESLLADCYARRDRVALIAFRRQSADLLLPPTRSLVAAKKRLARLPGGGGTPLASALTAAHELATGLLRRGERVQLVLLTDGRGNVTLDGQGAPETAQAQALNAARTLAVTGLDILLIDSSPRARPAAFELAQAMQAQYLPLPRAVAGGVGKAVRAALVDAA